MNPEERPNLISEEIQDESNKDWEQLLDDPQIRVAPGPAPAQIDPAYILLIVPGTVLIGSLMLYGALFYAAFIFKVTVGILISIPFLWLLISAMRPAMPDRECPKCGKHEIVLIDPQNDVGVRCLACPHVDREKRIAYLQIVMNDPEIAAAAGFVLDEYGEAQLPSKMSKS